MPYSPRSAPSCLSCKADAGERHLWPIHLARPFTDASGKRRTRTIPCRICKACVAELLIANAHFSVTRRDRPDLLERSRPLPPRTRVPSGRWASREQMLEASPVAAARPDR